MRCYPVPDATDVVHRRLYQSDLKSFKNTILSAHFYQKLEKFHKNFYRPVDRGPGPVRDQFGPVLPPDRFLSVWSGTGPRPPRLKILSLTHLQCNFCTENICNFTIITTIKPGLARMRPARPRGYGRVLVKFKNALRAGPHNQILERPHWPFLRMSVSAGVRAGNSRNSEKWAPNQ